MSEQVAHEDYVPGKVEAEDKPWHRAENGTLWLVSHKLDDPQKVLPVLCSVSAESGEPTFFDMMGQEYATINSFYVRDAQPVALTGADGKAISTDSFDFAIFLQG